MEGRITENWSQLKGQKKGGVGLGKKGKSNLEKKVFFD